MDRITPRREAATIAMSMKSYEQGAPRAPQGVVPSPRRALVWAVCGAAALAPLLATAGCEGGSNDQITGPVPLGMTSSMPPYYSDENTTIYESQKPVPLPVRKPSSAEVSGAAPKGTPYTHAPYLLASDESIELHYVITNVDTDMHSVWLLIDPWNEFVRWRPGITVVDDDVTVPNNGYDLAFSIAPQSRIEGTVTSDDFVEIATKLASTENLLKSPLAVMMDSADGGDPSYTGPSINNLCNNIFDSLNRSNSGDLLYMPWIPPVIAGITGFDLGIRTYEKANVAVEISIDIVDNNGNRFVQQDDTTTPLIGIPRTTLSPPEARF
jgi:hypothetical protein